MAGRTTVLHSTQLAGRAARTVGPVSRPGRQRLRGIGTHGFHRGQSGEFAGERRRLVGSRSGTVFPQPANCVVEPAPGPVKPVDG